MELAAQGPLVTVTFMTDSLPPSCKCYLPLIFRSFYPQVLRISFVVIFFCPPSRGLLLSCSLLLLYSGSPVAVK